MSITRPWLRMEAPREAGELVPFALRGEEGLSRPFSFVIDALSPHAQPDPASLLGRDVSVFVTNPAGAERPFCGVVSAFSLAAPAGRGLRVVRLTLVPRLALLGRCYDQRIFQNTTVPDLVVGILKEAGISDIHQKLSENYSERAYCVQYGESTLEFIERLLAEEGIFYFFRHGSGQAGLTLADNASAFGDLPEGEVAFNVNAPVGGAMAAWGIDYALHTGVWDVGGFDELAPSRRVAQEKRTVSSVNAMRGIAHYDYTGLPLRNGDDAAWARRRIEAEEATFQIARGTGLHAGFAPGITFSLGRAPVGSQDKTKWLITSVSHEALDAAAAPDGGETFYRNSFSAMPSSVPFRPLCKARPNAPGLQTATVVGPRGEDVYCDEYGRIKLQFHWDRQGKRNEHSSGWVRVAQNAAGSRWGTVFLPRVGQEVVVEFLHGDPDRPLVTGTVYNGDNRPPWSLPAQKTRSGFMSRTTPNGGAANANILSFEDKQGAEEVLLRAERNSLREVVHDDVVKVGHDQTLTVQNDRKLSIEKGSETVTIAKGNREVVLQQGKQSVTARSITLTASQSITFTCGETRVELTPAGATIKAMSVAINGEVKVDIEGGMTTVRGKATAALKGGLVEIN
ncbi:type VI secretion system Vgr family protein [Chelatococcus sp. GCM10030263]|uniref:type VI secretion system Vgr family protein n=1 Tax=Chelatococcus sp. GCM10030263 TaxID=3273387 RepID=UPI00360D83FD